MKEKLVVPNVALKIAVEMVSVMMDYVFVMMVTQEEIVLKRIALIIAVEKDSVIMEHVSVDLDL